MQNDLNLSLSQEQIKQNIMVIGLQQAGKTTLVQKFATINPKLFQETKIPDYDIELIDTPSYDFFFTLLPFRDPKVTGYIIIFCERNTDIMKSIKQIRKKLFSINGQHKRTIILFNESTFDNMSSKIQEEIKNIQYWCKQQDIIFSQIDVKRASSKEIINLFEKMFMKKIRTTLTQKTFIIFQYAITVLIFLYALWLSIKDPSLIITNVSLEIYCLALLCLGISNIFIPYFLRVGIKDSNNQCINRVNNIQLVSPNFSVVQLLLSQQQP